MTPGAFLDHLAAAAGQAEAAEAAYRREAAARIAALESERSFAYRRLNWMKAVAEVVAGAADDDGAVAHARAALRTRLRWDDDNAAHEEVLARFAVIARAMFAAGAASEIEQNGDVAAALAEFEAWYGETHGRSFWALFETYMPETPLVDF